MPGCETIIVLQMKSAATKSWNPRKYLVEYKPILQDHQQATLPMSQLALPHEHDRLESWWNFFEISSSGILYDVWVNWCSEKSSTLSNLASVDLHNYVVHVKRMLTIVSKPDAVHWHYATSRGRVGISKWELVHMQCCIPVLSLIEMFKRIQVY